MFPPTKENRTWAWSPYSEQVKNFSHWFLCFHLLYQKMSLECLITRSIDFQLLLSLCTLFSLDKLRNSGNFLYWLTKCLLVFYVRFKKRGEIARVCESEARPHWLANKPGEKNFMEYKFMSEQKNSIHFDICSIMKSL